MNWTPFICFQIAPPSLLPFEARILWLKISAKFPSLGALLMWSDFLWCHKTEFHFFSAKPPGLNCWHRTFDFTEAHGCLLREEKRNLNAQQRTQESEQRTKTDIQVFCVNGSQVSGCIPSPQELVQHADTCASPSEILIPNSETLRNTHDYSDPSIWRSQVKMLWVYFIALQKAAMAAQAQGSSKRMK